MLVYDRQDSLQSRFVQRVAGAALSPPVHWVPSSQGFVAAATLGLGWGMDPEALVKDAIARGELVDLAPRQPQDVALYWQHWRLELPVLRELTAAVRAAARQGLRPVAAPR